MMCPCRGCRERVAGSKDGPSCHAGCEKYKEWRAFIDARREAATQVICINPRQPRAKRKYERTGRG